MVTRREGFTLIELLIVVTIIGILASIATPSFVAAQDRARNAKAQGNLQAMRTAMETYGADHRGVFPAAEDLWNDDPDLGLFTNGYMPGNRPPTSPWGGAYQRGVVAPEVLPTMTVALAEGDLVKGEPSIMFRPETTGAVPTKYPRNINHFGAITLDTATGGTVYAMSIVGKKDNLCLVAGSVTNTGVATPTFAGVANAP